MFKLLREIKTVLLNLRFLKYVRFKEYSMDEYKNLTYAFVEVHKDVIKPINKPTKTEWVYINGIDTTYLEINQQLSVLSTLLKSPVSGIVNDSKGFWLDVFESMLGRTFNRPQPVTVNATNYIKILIKSGKPVKIIGHSQGAIILSNVVKLLIKENIDLSNVEFFTIGGANDEFPNVPCAEHFGNEKDPIFRISVLEYITNVSGSIFINEKGKGHLFLDSYLRGLVDGSFCDGASRLYGYFNKIDV